MPIRRVTSDYARYLTGIVRDRGSSPSDVREALARLGAELGRHVLEAHFLRPAVISTPMNDEVETLILSNDSTLVITTKSDMLAFGTSVAAALSPARIGYMNFEGRRGLEALRTPVREVDIPEMGGVVKNLVVAKSTLATGCTAISITRCALDEVDPESLIILTVFYSLEGLQELQQAFPDAEIFCIGEPDTLDENGMLHPGIGLLEERI